MTLASPAHASTDSNEENTPVLVSASSAAAGAAATASGPPEPDSTRQASSSKGSSTAVQPPPAANSPDSALAQAPDGGGSREAALSCSTTPVLSQNGSTSLTNGGRRAPPEREEGTEQQHAEDSNAAVAATAAAAEDDDSVPVAAAAARGTNSSSTESSSASDATATTPCHVDPAVTATGLQGREAAAPTAPETPAADETTAAPAAEAAAASAGPTDDSASTSASTATSAAPETEVGAPPASPEAAPSKITTVPREEADEPQGPPTEPPRGAFYYHTVPRLGIYTEFIRYLLFRGLAQDNCDASAEENSLFTKKYYNTNFIQELCSNAKNVLTARSSIDTVTVAPDETLIVVGDIHGQFFDLCTSVLSQQFSPDKNPQRQDRKFLFLGDFVDRGANSIEVILLTLALLAEYPGMIYMTRGNHEEYKTCKVYGFFTEAEFKLGSIAGNVAFSMITSVFLHVPLAARVAAPHVTFFATHGGISPGLEKDVQQLDAIERRLYGGKDASAKMDPAARDLVYGLLWSDPTNDACLYKPNPRGCGFLFGVTASVEFCRNHHFDFICRAHQVVMEGYLWRHHDKVLTVFSAPNYCGINGNLGAVMVVDGGALQPRFAQYEAYEDMDYPAVPEHINFPFKWCFE